MTIHGIVTAHVTTVGMKPSSSSPPNTYTNTQVRAHIHSHIYIQPVCSWLDGLHKGHAANIYLRTQIYRIWNVISNLDRTTCKFLKHVKEILVLNVPTTYLQYQLQTLPHNQWYFWNLLLLGINAQRIMGSRNYMCSWPLINYRTSYLV